MKIPIKHCVTKTVLYESESQTLKECVVNAVASGADLSGADLSEAYLSGADLSEADLREADLSGADLSEAYLSGADLSGADLRGADLSGIKGYQNFHYIFLELVRREKIETITEHDWSMIGLIAIHLPCWGTIRKRFGDAILPLFKRLANNGYGEYFEKYEQVLKGE